MRTDAIDGTLAWSEDREVRFVKRLAEDIEMLQSAGLPNDIIHKVIGQYKYVRAMVDTPSWLWPAKRLPKGCRWANGIRKHQKGDGRSSSETIYLLEVGTDLYIRGWQALPGTKEKDCKCVYIRNYKRYPYKVFLEYFRGRHLLHDAIAEFCHNKGMRSGFVEGQGGYEWVFENQLKDHDPDERRPLDVGFRVLKLADDDSTDDHVQKEATG